MKREAHVERNSHTCTRTHTHPSFLSVPILVYETLMIGPQGGLLCLALCVCMSVCVCVSLHLFVGENRRGCLRDIDSEKMSVRVLGSLLRSASIYAGVFSSAESLHR